MTNKAEKEKSELLEGMTCYMNRTQKDKTEDIISITISPSNIHRDFNNSTTRLFF